MLKTELKLPFTWYTALEKQHRFRPQANGNAPFALIAPTTSLLPFQIKKAIGGTISATISIYYLDGTLYTTVTSSAVAVKATSDAEYLIYSGGSIAATLAPGCYYATITKGDTFYSECFQVVADLTPYLKLEWNNTCDIPPVVYQTGFVNIIYLDTYTEAIPPDVNEDGITSGAGEFIPTLQRLVAKHKIETFAPDYLLDAFAFMQMHDTISVTEGSDTAAIRRIKLTANYGEFNLGTAKIEFELLDDYVKTDCCNNLDLGDGGGGDPPPCISVGINGSPALPDGVVGVPYSYSFSLSGTSPFALSNIVKPAWLSINLSASNIVFTGTPTAPLVGNLVSFTISNCTDAITDFADAFDVIAVSGGSIGVCINIGEESIGTLCFPKAVADTAVTQDIVVTIHLFTQYHEYVFTRTIFTGNTESIGTVLHYTTGNADEAFSTATMTFAPTTDGGKTFEHTGLC